MHYSLAFLISGIIVLIYTVWRNRERRVFTEFQNRLRMSRDVEGLDLSGETPYTDCYAHEWIMDNVVRKRHGRLGLKVQEKLRDNPIFGVMSITLLLGSAAMVIGTVLIVSIIMFGPPILILAGTVLILIGPGNVKMSEELLKALLAQDFERLNSEDYAYVALSNRQIKVWIRTSMVIGVVFLALAPVGDLLPIFVGETIGAFVGLVLIQPALTLANTSFVLSLAYIVVLMVVVFYFIPKAIITSIKNRREGVRQTDEE